MKKKTCCICHRQKAVSWFGKKKGKVKPYCKTCWREYIKHLGSKDNPNYTERRAFVKWKELHTKENLSAFRNMRDNYPEQFKKFRKYLRWTQGSLSGGLRNDSVETPAKTYYLKRGRYLARCLLKTYSRSSEYSRW